MVINLTYLSDPNRGMTVTFDQDVISIGRGIENDMVIDDVHISAHHARLFRREGRVFIEDLGSTNGTFVNGQRITAPQPLTPGVTIQFGTTTTVRYIPESARVDRTVSASPGQIPGPPYPQPMPQPRMKKKFPVWIIIVILGIILLCVGVVVIGGGWAAFNFLQSSEGQPVMINEAMSLQTEQARVANTQIALSQAQNATATAQVQQAATQQAQQTMTAEAQKTQALIDYWRSIIADGLSTQAFYGPADGTLTHADDDNVESRYADVDFFNYVITAKVYPPYLTDEVDWDMGFFFRDEGQNSELRLAVESSGYFFLLNQNGEGENYIYEGDVQNLNLDLNTPNEMTLLVWDDQLIFFLNDAFIRVFDISSRMGSGDVALVSNVTKDNVIPGANVYYEDFGVYAVPVQ